MTSEEARLRIQVNGELREIAASRSLADLLDELAIDQRQVAVERNLEIVSKGDYAETLLLEGDKLEIVTFVGGG